MIHLFISVGQLWAEELDSAHPTWSLSDKPQVRVPVHQIAELSIYLR